MPTFTSFGAHHENAPLTPILETESKQPSTEGTLALSTELLANAPSHLSSRDPSPPSSAESSVASSPTSTSSSRKVNFPQADVVTSYSRPLGNDELWPLYYFEQHSRSCQACFDPYVAYKEGKPLCPTGHRLGLTVGAIIYSKSDGQEIYATSDLEKGGLTRIEVPRQYVEVRNLLRALEREVKARRKSERRRIVNHEDEGNSTALVRARQQIPDRSIRTEESRRKVRFYEPTLPAPQPCDVSPRRERRRSITRYHESELPSRRASPPSPNSTRAPVDIVQRGAPSAPVNIVQRSAPPTATTRPNVMTITKYAPQPVPQPVPQQNAMSSAPLPFRRRSLAGCTDGPSNCFPTRRQSVGGPPSSYNYSTSLPFKPSPLSNGALVRRSSLSSGSSNASSSAYSRSSMEGEARRYPDERRYSR